MPEITPETEALREILEARADEGLADSLAFEEELLLQDLSPELLRTSFTPKEPRG